MIEKLQREHPHVYLTLLTLFVIIVMLCMALLTQACQPPSPSNTPPAADGTIPPESFEVVRVDLGGAAEAQVVTELRVIGERVVVGVNATADAKGGVCATVSFRWGFLHASTDYPAKCSAPPPPDANPIIDVIVPLLDDAAL